MSKKPTVAENPKKVFADAMDRLSYRQNAWAAFEDFLDYCMIMLHWQDLTEENFDTLRQRYPEKKEQEAFAAAYFAMAEIAGGKKKYEDGLETEEVAGFIDPFGDYFMEHFSSSRAGQFFTPEHICDMMAVMTVGEGKNGQSVLDCCCGSGRMLLSAAKINRKMRFYAADIDETCAKMTLINFMLNSMVGEVAHMDTLGYNLYKSWKVTLVPYGDNLLPMYVTLSPDQSDFAQRVKATFDTPKEIKELKPFAKIIPASQSLQQSLF